MKRMLLLAFSVIVMTSAFSQVNPQTEPQTQPQTQPETYPETQPQTQPQTQPGTQPATAPEDRGTMDRERHEMMDRDQIEVKHSDLPKVVRDAISNDFSGWKAEDKAFKVKDESGKEIYKVTLRNTSSGETKTVKIDKDGKKVVKKKAATK